MYANVRYKLRERRKHSSRNRRSEIAGNFVPWYPLEEKSGGSYTSSVCKTNVHQSERNCFAIISHDSKARQFLRFSSITLSNRDFGQRKNASQVGRGVTITPRNDKKMLESCSSPPLLIFSSHFHVTSTSSSIYAAKRPNGRCCRPRIDRSSTLDVAASFSLH